jgi:hypothetical protein
MMRKAIAMLAAAAAFAAPAKAAEVNVWSTTFDLDNLFETIGPFPFFSVGVVFGGATIESAIGFPGFGTKLFRNPTGGTTVFDATGLGAHTHLRLKFDIAFLDSWDSLDGACCAPDILFVEIDGTTYEWTVNHALGTVFNVGPGTVISTGTNLGFNPGWPDTVVRYNFFFPHTSPNFSLKIRFGGAGFQGDLDESWAIDNFALLAVPAGNGGGGGGDVPAPASWLTLLAGVGLLGVATRRRTAQA